jgi:hypothetical protein
VNRYYSAAELAKLDQIWELDTDFANYLLPQQKLIFKQRNGAKVTKRYDTATTPHQRAINHDQVRSVPRQVVGRISLVSNVGVVGSARPRCTSLGRFQAMAS